MTEPNWHEIVQIVIDRHKVAGPCEFAPNAVNLIVDEALETRVAVIEMIDALESAINNHEIYCPHEGVDRRHLYGIQPTLERPSIYKLPSKARGES